jgi:hypothetical protein
VPRLCSLYNKAGNCEESMSDAQVLRELQKLPNVGPATAKDLVLLNIRTKEDLAARDPDELYESLCSLTGQRHDLCVRDVFASLVAFANGAPAKPWWHYTPERKAREKG